jgi:transcriptional adapter 2-alpha
MTHPSESCPSDGHERNLSYANKKGKETIGELDGWMPRRGEFESEFIDDADQILNGLEFDESDSAESFEAKVGTLVCYSHHLKVRQKRTKVADEWKLHEQKPRDQFISPLRGRTSAETDLDAKLLTFAPYIGRQHVQDLSQKLHNAARNLEQLQRWQSWQASGVRDLHEGFFLGELEAMIKDDRVSEADAGHWNRKMQEYPVSNEAEDAKLLTDKENRVREREGIPPPVFLAMKDLIIREAAARGGLSVEEAVGLLPEEADKMRALHVLFLGAGWISE